MSATTCRKIFERRNRIDKSNSGTTQESNHSGGTAKHSEPHQSLIKNEPERPEAVNEAKTNDILVIDDDIEESIRKEVLTLPQCVEMKVRDIRTNGERAEERRDIVVLKDASRNPLKKADGRRKLVDRSKNDSKTADIRNFLNRENHTKIDTMVFENSTRQPMKKEREQMSTEKKTFILSNYEDRRKVIFDKDVLVNSVEGNKNKRKEKPRSREDIIETESEVLVKIEEISQNDQRNVITSRSRENKSEVNSDSEEDQRKVVDTTTARSRENKSEAKIEMIDSNSEEEDQRKITGKEAVVVSNVEKDVIRNLNVGNPKDIISEGFITLRRRDYRTLTGTNHLNDQIINQYLHLVQERSRQPGLQKVYALSTHAYTGLDLNFEHNYKKEVDFLEKASVDLEDQDLILIPIHKREHWSLVTFKVKEKVLSYHDSILGTRKTSNALKIIERFLTRYFKSKGIEVVIKKRVEEKAALQRNSYDCGVFVCENAEILSRQDVARPRQEDMQNIRNRMIKELIQDSLSSVRSTDIFETARETALKQQSQKKERKKTGADTEAQVKPRAEVKYQKSKNREDKSDEKIKETPNSKPESSRRKERINWPKGNSPEWSRLNEDMSALLRTLIAPAEVRSRNYPNVIYGMCRERFGIKEVKERKETQAGPSRRQKKCTKLREEINLLKKAVEEAPEHEKEAIKELQSEKLKKLRLAKRAETLRKSRKKYAKNCNEFLSQPYDFARNILSPKPKGEMESSKEDVEKFLEKAHSDPVRDQVKELSEELEEYKPPK